MDGSTCKIHPLLVCVRVKSCHIVLIERKVNEKCSVNIPSTYSFRSLTTTTAETDYRSDSSRHRHSVSQSVTPLRLVAVVGLVSTLTHTISVRVDESPAATATTTALNYCRQPAPVSLRCFDVACRAEGKSLVGPLNVGLSLSLFLTVFSFLVSRSLPHLLTFSEECALWPTTTCTLIQGVKYRGM